MSKVIRSVKNVTKGYSSVQVKVRDATSNDPWGPTGTQMSEIAQLTFNTSTEFYEIMDMLDKRLNDKGKNWRHVLKALKVLDYCLHEGSELVVTWARQSIYVIKTLREFQYIDEDGRDVGQNVRVAAKELTSLILDEERLRAERSDRKSWKSRVTGLEEQAPPFASGSSQRPGRERPGRRSNDDDAEYRLAIEASKHQEEEDRKKRESRAANDVEDDDLAKAIKLSKEEEERRRRELEESNASALFDDEPTQPSQAQYTGFNQGYQQGSAVDFFANPIDQFPNQVPGQAQQQHTGFVNNAYTGYQPQPQPQQVTGYSNAFGTMIGMQPMNADPYGQQQQHALQSFTTPNATFNPYLQSQAPQSQNQLDPTVQAGSNNPWATGNSQQQQSASPMRPMQTGSNNPFAPSATRPAPIKASTASALSSLPEQKTLSTFNPTPTSYASPARELTEHEAKLNALLAGSDGLDTFGNTGNLRIPAQHTAPGTFVNSAGSGLNRLTGEATGSNPFLKSQFTGMPSMSYGGGVQMPSATGPVGLSGAPAFGAQPTNNPFAGARPPQQNPQAQDLIQF